MGHFTVINADETMYLDRVAVSKCDMSGLPDDLHALQWDGASGHVEYTSVTKPNLSINSEAELESALGVSLSTLMTRRTERQLAEEAKQEEERKRQLAEEAKREEEERKRVEALE
jgi:hypothetical protein